MKKAIMVIMVIGILLCGISICGGDVNYDFVKQQGEVEQKVGPMVRKTVNIITGIGLGVCIISVAIGACKWFGQFMSMDKDKGADKVKRGVIGILVFGSFWAILATIFNIADL